MEYKTLGELAGQAKVSLEPVLASTPMTKRERLERWAILLEREPERQLSSVEEVEYGTCRRAAGQTGGQLGPGGGVRRSGAARARPDQRPGRHRGRFLRTVALGDPSSGLLVPLRAVDGGWHRSDAGACHGAARGASFFVAARPHCRRRSAAAVGLLIAIL